jgi:riboflavin biosynthesis pyrimidine reductase
VRIFGFWQKVAARQAELDKRNRLDALKAKLAQERDEGQWVATEETTAKIETLQETGGAAIAAEALWQRLEKVKSEAGPGHVAVGRLQCLLATAVQSFPSAQWYADLTTAKIFLN